MNLSTSKYVYPEVFLIGFYYSRYPSAKHELQAFEYAYSKVFLPRFSNLRGCERCEIPNF